MKTLPFLFILGFCVQGKALGPPSVQANKDGIGLYNEENYVGAFKDFAKALGKDAYNPTFHFNLGDAFLKNGDVGKAITEYEAVEKNPKSPRELKFKAMFNAGNAAIQAKDVPKALSYYQRALNYRPDSSEVKTNIELALKDPQGGSDDKNDKQDQKQKQNNEQNQKDKNDNGQQDKKDEKKDPSQPKDEPKQQSKPQAKPFQSQALNEGDVRRILEELKRQEEQIRAKQNMDNKKIPEQPIEKDW